MIGKERKKRTVYSYETKLEAAQRVHDGENVKEVAQDLDIKDFKRIYMWLNHYQKGQLDRLKDARQESLDKDARIKELEMENEILKKYLNNLNRE